ncbi:glycosyl hydrolase [Pseudobutyrivibrio xylanivorans]|uniref:F5/8 type C domain-containing protein n=1 Tax=Pseudobutyrivibrio xylanivorans DSM 14809 TaxID=1123012 RepID=A0A1M6A2Q6_PSEXY|nr:glycosyl hydrolase [Pseudobutyrivibrio xylanivorans]SHI30787.1 F5/8 type C domain-containing protein [Pseudobutyrivibrio xylanivorans DSM 14809]
MEKKKYLVLGMICASVMFGGNKTNVMAAGNENIAYNRPVTVSSVEGAGLEGSKLVDADGNTRWSSQYQDNQYVIVDLGQSKSISKVRIDWEAAYASQYQIQISNDNSSWTTVYENYNANGSDAVIDFNPVNARYVKIYCIKRATSYGFSIYEFEIYENSSSQNTSTNNGTANVSKAKESKEKVINFLYQQKGKKTVIGIHNREPNSQPSKQTNQAYNITGQYAGLWSGDFLFSQDDVNNRWNMIYECERQWNQGSIVQLMLHVTPPTKGHVGSWDGDVCSHLSDQQWNDLITDGGYLNGQWKKRLDDYAVYFQYLKDKGIPVLFRPFHEMNQGMFWWAGRTGDRGSAELFRLTRYYLEHEKGLDNIIWVWDMQDLSYDWSAYNPGNNNWDIFAVDIYNNDRFTSYKYNLAKQIANGKLFAVGECDKIPTANELRNQPEWSFVMSWAELTFSYNSNQEIQNLYWADNVLIRSELPSFK